MSALEMASRGYQLVLISIIFTAGAFTVVLVRCWTRFLYTKHYGVDDFFIILAMVSVAAYLILA